LLFFETDWESRPMEPQAVCCWSSLKPTPIPWSVLLVDGWVSSILLKEQPRSNQTIGIMWLSAVSLWIH
jgi:hypothetical protein